MTTTYNDTNKGRGIRCDNTTILCNSKEYYCDGSVVTRDLETNTTAYSTTSHETTTYNEVE